ncbi:HET-domain-containing protein [Diaporthe amygdali]|uniref:HET-domain-containing protein n=1 Tax=Phomopsis amygdali TaxID=1214568 RepID=UPI0022FE1C69|nr:HET-domain-containing protein [Diaporthe amygdali]KAJ0124601.1 HET-domain-containing protein [Diaporthe amygdali]
MLCALCLSMFSSGRHAGLHHACIEDLGKAAKGGCKICSALLLRRSELSPDPENEETAMPFLSYKWAPDANFIPSKSGNGSRPRCWEIQFDSKVRWLNWGEMPWNAIYIHVSYKSEAVPDWYARLSGHAASDLDSEPWRVRREMFPLRRIPDSTGHKSVLEIGKMWMENCERSHNCEISNGPVDSEWYPKRLIYIPEATSPRLLETSSERPHGRYATLSHCWGSNPSFVTLTSANLNHFRRGIPVDILASSFRDAMVICNRLSIRYIWIDSLCILQDSESDWLFHTEEMSSIYRNCYLNLSFDAAANPEQGAFRQRNPDIIQECCAFSVIPRARVTPRSSDSEVSGTSSNEALSDDSLKSSSDDGENSNDGPVEASSRESEPANAGESLRRPFNCFPGGKPDWSPSDHFGQWANIVGEYSGCLLTYPEKDKLVALAAVAQRYATVFGEEYYAGHFRVTIPSGLGFNHSLIDMESVIVVLVDESHKYGPENIEMSVPTSGKISEQSMYLR